MDRFTEPILHVDMDAFFVEVERLRDSSLHGKAVVVGGMGRRSVVASASYEARGSGVRSAMSMVEAQRRCPHLVRVPPNHRRYREVSEQVFAVLRSFTPHVEGLSVDEAFLDVSGLRLHYDTPRRVAESIRASLRESPGLPASVGIAPTKFVAKLASQEAKPDGIAVVRAGAELEFLHPLPVRRLWGVGQATHAALEGLGVGTIGDVAGLPQSLLERRLGPALGAHLAALAHGIDDRAVVPNSGAKSISVEETYERDLGSDADIVAALASLCHRLDGRLRRSASRGHTATIKVRFADFTMVSRSTTQQEPFAHEAALISAAEALWAKVDRAGRGVRLLGIGVSGLEPRDQPVQLALGEGGAHPAAAVVDEIRHRFGDDAVLPGRFVPAPHGAPTGAQPDENLSG